MPCRQPFSRPVTTVDRFCWVVKWLLIGFIVLVLSWLVMIVLAKRLPPGSAKDLATVLPACVTTVRRLRRDPRVPRSSKLAVAFAGLWVLSPIDLIPEFLPVIGPLDDVVVVALALRFAARRVPQEAIYEAWPADPKLLDRLLGNRPSPAAQAASNSRLRPATGAQVVKRLWPRLDVMALTPPGGGRRT